MKRFALLFVNGFTLRDRFYVQAKDKDVPREMTTGKRTDYISWNDFHMGTALLAAQRSKDPNTQVGACIVNKENMIVGIGYNGMPVGCSDDDLPWGRGESRGQDQSPSNPRDVKYGYVCHAEMNALVFRNTADVRGCKMYTSLFPCNECAKVIIQSGIRKVVYLSDKKAKEENVQISKILLTRAHVKYRKYKPDQDTISINLKDF